MISTFPCSANEVHTVLHRKVVEVRQKMEQLQSRMVRLEEQAQAAVEKVEQLKEENRVLKEYRKALEDDIAVEIMGFENGESSCNNNQSNPKQQKSICKKEYITFLKDTHQQIMN